MLRATGTGAPANVFRSIELSSRLSRCSKILRATDKAPERVSKHQNIGSRFGASERVPEHLNAFRSMETRFVVGIGTRF